MQPSSFMVWLCAVGCSIGANGFAGECRLSTHLNKHDSATFVQRAKLMPADGAVDDECGHVVALSSDGNTALIGAPYANLGAGTNQGAVYVFTRSGDSWTQQQKLVADDCASNDIFGCAVALSHDGGIALIGAPNAAVNGNVYQGAAYVFIRYLGNWIQHKKLTADDGAAGHLFGYAVALSADGSNALVGATWGMITNHGAGGYVFTRESGWDQQAKLTSADGIVNDGFGSALALSSDGGTALIGAQNARAGVISGVGAAYVFTRYMGAWSQQNKLVAADGTQGAHFGNAMALSGNGDTALIGAFSALAGGNMPGAAYVFTRSGSVWSQRTKLAAADGTSWADFGFSVALSSDGSTALIGAPDANVGETAEAGAAYVFKYSGGSWSQRQKLAATDGVAYDYFGWAVALSGAGDTTLIGAYYPRSMSWKQKKGAAYVFAATEPPPACPTIKANGATDNTVVDYPAPLTVTAEMNAGVYAGALVDWWVVAFAHAGQWYYLNNTMQWMPFNGNLAECRPVYQGTLFDLPATTVLDQYQLSRGTYDFWFAVDYPMDGILNPAGQIMMDKVTVVVQ